MPACVFALKQCASGIRASSKRRYFFLPVSILIRSDDQMLPPSDFWNFPMLMLAVVQTP